MHSILAINTGSTSTKLAVYCDETQVSAETIHHDTATLRACGALWDQFELRWQAIDSWTARNVERISAVASIGGLFRPVPGGIYAVNERMLSDARANLQGEHASNLSCAVADRIAGSYGCRALVVDPVSVDELEPAARYSGHPAIERRSLSHALNIHATARRAVSELGLPFDESRIIVAHMGGGISVAPVLGGRIVDVNDAASDGPFSPERTGGLPLQVFLDLCFSGSYSERELRRMVMGRGGLVAYLGTNSAVEVEARIHAGDAVAGEVYQAMAYQISKEIGAMATVLRGAVHAVVLAGGLARSAILVDWIRQRTQFLAPVLIYPGEDEMRALAEGALRVLRAEAEALEY
jgi:butyrate kinase